MTQERVVPRVAVMKTRAEFLAARRGRRLNGPFFFIEVLDRKDGLPGRLGLTVTRKVGNSVERNRIRRRLREAVRTECGADMAVGFDYVIVARREMLGVPFDMLKGELSRRFARTRTAAGPTGSASGGHPSGTD